MDLKDLSGERLDLRRVGLWGLEDMHEYSRLPEFYAPLEGEPLASIEETRSYLNGLIARSAGETDYFWFLYLRSEQKVIGSVGLYSFDKRRQSTGVGYGLSPFYQRKGYMREALLLLMDYLFNDVGIYRLHALCPVENLPSINAVEKLGFTKEGTLRAHYVYPERRVDGIVVSLLKPEYDVRWGTSKTSG